MQKQDQQYIPGLDSMALPRDEEVDAVSAEYLRREEEFNEIDWTRRLYAKGSDALARGIRAQWQSFCHKVKKDPVEELKCFEVKRLSLFFHFVLAQRRATLRHTSTLQTYWNTLCLVRKRETGLQHVPSHVKEAM
ncbi:hypothetical protein LTR56_027328, partial [Elasticomyces elasticus]